jgi:putative ABC transport system permease protein
VIYRLIIAVVLDMGVDPNYLRFFYALMLTVFLSLPLLKKKLFQLKVRHGNRHPVKQRQAVTTKTADTMAVSPMEQQKEAR